MLPGSKASVGKKVGAKYAGNLYQEIQHDNGDRYVVRAKFLIILLGFIIIF
jgi:hypothetical protein